MPLPRFHIDITEEALSDLQVMESKDEYVPISCADYETLEVACMDRYDVELTTRDGRTVAGKAVDIAVRPPGEFLVVRHDDGTTEDVRVDQVRYMVVLSHPSRFDEHTFATQTRNRPGGS